MSNDKIAAEILRIWEKSVDTQMHFNDLIMRNRTIVVSFVTAVFGAAAYSLREKEMLLTYVAKIFI